MKTLREWRAQQLLTIRDLAERAGISSQTIVQIEHARKTPRVRTIRRICDALEVEPSEVTEFAAAIGQVADQVDADEAEEPAAPPAAVDATARLQPLIDVMPDSPYGGISGRNIIGYILAPDGLVRYASPSFERIMGEPSQAQNGSDIFDAIIQYVHPDDQYETMRLIHYVLVTPGAVEETTHRLRFADGAWHEMRLHGANLIDNPALEGIILCSSELAS